MPLARWSVGLDEVAGQAPRCLGELHVSMSGAEADAIAAVCQALASPARVRLVALLRDWPGGEASADDLAQRAGWPPRTVDHHLRPLTAAGLVLRRRSKAGAWYSLKPQRLQAMVALLGERSATTG